MAVKTEFANEDMIEILTNYSLGEYLDSWPARGGTVQTNYFIQTTAGKFVFRYYENRSRGSVLFESSLIKYLKDRDYPCPGLYKNNQGRYVGRYRGKPYVLFEFIAGQHLENPDEAQQRQLIRKAAELQKLTQNYSPRCRKYRWNYEVRLCRELAHDAAEKINTENSREKLEWFDQALSNLRLPESLPRGICHCDFHFSNVLFKDGEFAALIDFDDANYTYLTYDLATLIEPFVPAFDWDTWQQFSPEAGVFDFGAARRVAAEYNRARPLSPVEKRHFFDVYQLSILFDGIWYFARGEAGNFYERRKIEYLNRLGRERFYAGLFSP